MNVHVNEADFKKAIDNVMVNLTGIDDLYPGQYDLLEALMKNENIFYTSATNSGKTLPAVMYPEVLKHLSSMGYEFPRNPRVLFVTQLNSIKLSLLNNVQGLGISCESVSNENVNTLMDSDTSVLFISPEVLKSQEVTKVLLKHRSDFVLKVVDEAHLGKMPFKVLKLILDLHCYHSMSNTYFLNADAAYSCKLYKKIADTANHCKCTPSLIIILPSCELGSAAGFEGCFPTTYGAIFW